jgi:hypothetical protein
MKQLFLLLIVVVSTANAGTEIIYERTQSIMDYGLKVSISVLESEAKLTVTRRSLVVVSVVFVPITKV